MGARHAGAMKRVAVAPEVGRVLALLQQHWDESSGQRHPARRCCCSSRSVPVGDGGRGAGWLGPDSAAFRGGWVGQRERGDGHAGAFAAANMGSGARVQGRCSERQGGGDRQGFVLLHPEDVSKVNCQWLRVFVALRRSTLWERVAARLRFLLRSAESTDVR